MSLLQLSKRTPDLLAKDSDVPEEEFKQMQLADKKKLEAPQTLSNAVPHELLSDTSRMTPKVENYLAAQRMLLGNAQTEQMILELNCASQINRGPEGVFESSRLHWDMLLNRDETIFPSDYLNFDAKMKF
ncbi:unnamed protein product [Caenorhabditis auriculariae]|uniref:Uncharacterized protein n=1 Tax=Caenorhabditis auriculariae TaxID=2777116 RepID=A0A8S1HSQ5_9PELO|nr:unnamed protein product [Caenorhabditis auriculariae]